MRTIASLADRLDMSAEQALETLRRLKMPVDGVDAEINDVQCDILMDVDEDPSTLDKLLADLEKKEEEKRKKTERLLKGAQKAAAKKKAAKAKAKPKAKAKAKTEEDVSEAALAAPPAPEVVVLSEDLPAPLPEPEVVESDDAGEHAMTNGAEVATATAVADEAPPAPAVEELPPVEAPAEEATPPVPRFEAEILPPASPDEVDTRQGRHVHHAHEHGRMGALAEAELRQKEEEERRKRKELEREKEAEREREEDRPLPVPDPAVVAEVIRRAKEKEMEKNRAQGRGRAPGGTGGPGAPMDMPFNAALGPRGGAPRPKPARGGAPDPGLVPLGPPKAGANLSKAQRKKQKRTEKARALDEHMRREAAAAVRGVQAGFGAKKRKKRRDRENDLETQGESLQGGVIEVEETMTVEELARAMGFETNDIILELMEQNILATKNQRLELETIRRIAEKHNFEVETVIPEEADILAEEEDDPAALVPRPPVVTVMGHVDHGKTSLLDVVREANVVAGESGGITQHIAAYDVETKAGRVVFLDTPGHAAFTQMRARGAQVTDLVILVVAADDGVKPQTIEAIDHAKAADVKIVVAINKCDKPDAEPDRVRQELTQHGLVDEAWGGDTFMKNISCHTREGIDELMEMLVLTADIMTLKANPAKRARGAVVESEMLRGQGPVAWVLVQNGTLKQGDLFLCGTTHGRVRTLLNSRGEQIESAGPATPVLVTGFNVPPDAGDQFVVLEDERVARNIADKRLALARQRKGPAVKHMTLEDFHARMLGQDQKSLNIIVKADVQGSVDVLESSFAKLGNEEVSVTIVHSGVGAVNESDVMLASASDAVIIGFHVVPSPKVQKMADDEGVEVRLYRIIYEAMDDVKKALEGMLTPDSAEVVTGHAEIRAVFRSSALGNIAGCIQQDGETLRGGKARLVRDGVVLHDGVIATLRRGKDDVRTVGAGYECGIKMEKFDDIAVGDIIESYKVVAVAKKLE